MCGGGNGGSRQQEAQRAVDLLGRHAPQLGCYGDATVRSPNIDRLAKREMLFERSYVQQAFCSPARILMLSGRYPATTRIFEIGPPLRSTMPDITTVPQHFKKHGYHCRSFVEWTKPGQSPVRELYDQTADPLNDVNLAGKADHAELLDALSKQLRERFPVTN